jgi:hypothetical protein
MVSTVKGFTYVTSPSVACSSQEVSETKFDTTNYLKSEEYRFPDMTPCPLVEVRRHFRGT